MNKKDLQKMIGKKIVSFEYPRTWNDGNKTYLHTPIIRLENGSSLQFSVEEGDGDYGISVSLFTPLTEIKRNL